MTANSSGAAIVPPLHPRSVWALVVGLIGLPLPFFGPVALYLGLTSTREMGAQPGRWSGRGLAVAGLVLGVVGTLLLIIPVVGLLLLFTTSS